MNRNPAHVSVKPANIANCPTSFSIGRCTFFSRSKNTTESQSDLEYSKGRSLPPSTKKTMKFQRRHSVDSSLSRLEEEVRLELKEEETIQPPPSSARPRIERRHSMTSVVSLGLIVGSSAFITPQAAPPVSAFRPQMARSASDNLLVGKIAPTAAGRPRMARRSSDKGPVISKMLPVDAAVDVATGVSQAASFFGDSPLAEMPNILASKISTTEVVASALFGVGRTIVEDNKEAQSELLTDFSHIAGDMMGFLTPNKATLQAGMVVARIFSIMADYLPDQMIRPEEAVFQACMLGVSTSLLAKSVKPMIDAKLNPTSYRDKRAYQALFRQFGLSWVQFKSLTANAAEWVELAPHEEIVSENGDDDEGDFFYWTYKGEADLIKDESVIQRGHEGLGLLGELGIARKLPHRNRNRNIRSTRSTKDQSVIPSTPSPKVRAGAAGAKLLKINTAKLLELMDHDEQFADSINNMILGSLQEKLSNMYLEPAVAY